MRPEFDRLYALSDAGQGLRVAPTVPLADPLALLHGDGLPERPMEFVEDGGRVARDVILGGPPSVFLVSDAFVAALEVVDATGWTSYPVAIRRRSGDPIDGYRGLSITGRAGPTSFVGAELVMGRLSTDGPAVPMVRGMGFDLGSWDGSDLFLLRATAHIIASQKVRDSLRRAKVRGISLERLSELTRLSATIGIGGAANRPGLAVRVSMEPAARRPLKRHAHLDLWLDRALTPDGSLPQLHGACIFPDGDMEIEPGASGIARLVPDVPVLFPDLAPGAVFEIVEDGVVGRGVVLGRPN